ncbi:MAG: FG-GAP-like repeat-containing protein [Calditrichaceae bacterium]
MICKKILLIILIIPSAILAQADPVNWTKRVISDAVELAKKNAVADLDLDGDLDIVCTANPEGGGVEDPGKINVMWFENNGAESFTRRDIDASFVGARGLAVGDLTGDGYPDVAAGSARTSKLVWYKNDGSPANGGWVKSTLGGSAPLNYQVLIVDLDRDGDLDIVDGMGDDATSGSVIDSLRWFENNGLSSPSFAIHKIAGYSSPSAVAAADFDGDNLTDIVSMSWLSYSSLIPVANEDARWWKQVSADSWTQQQIIQQSYGGNDAVAVDLDEDGDMDIVGAGYKDQSVGWWANNGSGVFNTINRIKTSFKYTRNVIAADLDSDGDLDIAACADTDNTVSWFENDGYESFTEHTVTTNFTYAYFVSAADMDGDGDMDLIGTAQDKIESGGTILGQLAWWENDLNESKTISAGDQPAENFWNNKVAIDFASGSPGEVSVFYNKGKNTSRGNLASGIDHIAERGKYTIVTNKTTYDCAINFSYAGISEWSAINNESDLLICFWNDQSGMWEIAGTSQDVSADKDSILVRGLSTQLKRYSLFTIASATADNSLPVELVSFDGQVTGEGILLNWATASEIENRGFEIWRKSGTDSSFSLNASYRTDPALEGLGTSGHGQEYFYTDRHVSSGEIYTYKLINHDYNGRINETRKITITFIPQNMAKIVDPGVPNVIRLAQNYPNPFNGRTSIEFSVSHTDNQGLDGVVLDIYNVLGQKVKTLYEGSLTEGAYLLSWDSTDQNGHSVASGVYFYRLSAGGQTIIKRLLLQK